MARQNAIVGLDIGRHSVKAVWAEQRGHVPAITRAEFLRLPSDSSDSRSVIGSWIAEIRLAKFPCVIGLPGQQSMFQPLQLVPADPRTLEQVAAMEVVKFNDMASEEMIFGFAPFSVNPGERRLILSMVRPSVLEKSLSFSEKMGLDIIDIVPSPVALFTALELHSADHPAPYVYVNIGCSTTEIAIGSRTGLMFARSFASGGQMFTDALAKTANLSVSQAENLKVIRGSLLEGDQSIVSALTRVADLWLLELQSCLSIYRNLFTEEKTQLARVILAGGASELHGFPEYIAGKLNIETVRVNSLLPGDLKFDKPAHFVVAAGLAVTGLEIPSTHVSLLPPQMRDEMTFRRQKHFWISAVAAAALILAVSLVGGYRDFRRKEKHLNAQKVSLGHRQGLVTQIESVKASSAQIQRMAEPLRNWLRAALLMRNLITLVADSISPNDWITMICDANFYSSPPRKPGMPDRQQTAKLTEKDSFATGLERIVIEGYTRTYNLTTVKELIAKLTAADFIASADLLSDDKLVEEVRSPTTLKDWKARRFVIDVNLTYP